MENNEIGLHQVMVCDFVGAADHMKKSVDLGISILPQASRARPIHAAETTRPPDDINKNGMLNPIILTADGKQLVDGRSRPDACELAGLPIFNSDGSPLHHLLAAWARERGLLVYIGRGVRGGWRESPLHNPFRVQDHGRDKAIRLCRAPGDDPYARAFSLNLERRPPTAEQKHEVMARPLLATPERSDRQIVRELKSRRHAIKAVRKQAEARGQIACVATRTDSVGRRQAPVKARPTKPDVLLRRQRTTVYAFSGKLARHIVGDLSPARAEEFPDAPVHDPREACPQ